MRPSEILNMLSPQRNGSRKGRRSMSSKKEMPDSSQIHDRVVHILALDVSDPQISYITVFEVSMITKVLTEIAK